LRTLGPGLVTGAADDDPSGISTYSVAGASTGFSMLWIILITAPMMIAIQGMCARIGLVTGMGLAAAMKAAFPRPLVMFLAVTVVAANTFNLGADLAGMAASARLLAPATNFNAWIVVFGAVILFAEVFLSYRNFERVVKWLCISLLAYVATAFIVRPHWGEVIRSTFVPQWRFNAHWTVTLMGVLGTTITPYLFFWQPAMVVEGEKAAGLTKLAQRRGATPEEIADVDLDNRTGMIYSNLVSFFIIVTTAATLGAHGRYDISTAQQAAEALRPLAGVYAYLLFTLGMVGTGLLAVPVLAGSSAYVLAELMGFAQGLGERPRRARGFYAVIVLGIGLGMLMNFARVDPIQALFWSAVINGLAAVPLLTFIVILANRRSVMGPCKSSLAANLWGWATVALMSVAAISMFVFWGKS
jgi:NRAMP (natural resistance-associated macrophage protein)-like metal ion transporter